jgi:hypothetical protein
MRLCVECPTPPGVGESCWMSEDSYGVSKKENATLTGSAGSSE